MGMGKHGMGTEMVWEGQVLMTFLYSRSLAFDIPELLHLCWGWVAGGGGVWVCVCIAPP